MNKKFLWPLLGMVVAVALVVAGCGDDDDSSSEPTAMELVIGRVLPETGSLAFLAPPMVVGARLAVEDIQAAGGNVRMITGDTATDLDVAPETVNRLLGEGAHVIVGAASSGVSQSFIQTLFDAQIPQCSPSNTSPSFSIQDNAGFYFRTVTPDDAQAPLLANHVAARGATNVAIVARADDYGNQLSKLTQAELADAGVDSRIISYDEDAPSYDGTIGEAVSMGANAIVLISFSEGIQILRGLLESGVPPTAIFASDGLYDLDLADKVDRSNPNVVDGLIAFSADFDQLDEDFSTRLLQETDNKLTYGGQAYDCVVVLALASLAAGSTDGRAIMDEVQGVTRDGTKCFDYEECAGLIADGENIDYDGVSGPLDLDDVGDPTWGRYVVSQFQDGVLTPIDSQEVDRN
ncbi:ABC transporter substrate-binding protein [Candidatus Poriferisocius sp.]|uniref:ABC transporter substrate-binding protein n=1 Tax=Candidatus Poriferisocius sp. TaxID=3101276 RepID=UPI003B01EA0C